MKAEIISIGTELLLGEITDLNSAYLASQLPLLGLDLRFISTVGDNQQRLIETLNLAWQRSDIIITTGGLGPTEDDITREAIAEFFKEPITIDQSLVDQFKASLAGSIWKCLKAISSRLPSSPPARLFLIRGEPPPDGGLKETSIS